MDSCTFYSEPFIILYIEHGKCKNELLYKPVL